MIRAFALCGTVACLVGGPILARAEPPTSQSLASEPLASESPASEPAPTHETILFIRHAEKQAAGLGQLSCRGLNRALALPAVLQARYGRIDAVFAPDPSHQKQDGPRSYDYVRPLATVEPTAIRFGVPVHAALGYEETAKLQAGLLLPEFRNAIVLVAWEHHALNALVPEFLASLGGRRDLVTPWSRDDFDSIWQVTIDRSAAGTGLTFSHKHQNLDGQPDVCPNAASPPLESTAPTMLEHNQNKLAR